MTLLTQHWNNEDDTAGAAFRLAQNDQLADCIVSLEGGLGAGKTTFARHLLRALGAQGRIKSPSYALLEPYPQLAAPWGVLDAWHIDLYRLRDAREFPDSELAEVFATAGLKIVEWLAKAGAYAPAADLSLRLHIAEDGCSRRVSAQAHKPRGQSLLESLR